MSLNPKSSHFSELALNSGMHLTLVNCRPEAPSRVVGENHVGSDLPKGKSSSLTMTYPFNVELAPEALSGNG